VNPKNRQIYFYIILSLCLLLSAILFLRIILPSIKTWSALKKEIQHKDKELQLRYNTIQQNQQLKNEIAAIEKTYGDFNRMFFVRDDMPAAVKAIADISKDLQIEFISLTPLPSQKLEDPSLENEKPGFSLWKTPISIKIKTNYLKLIDFIKRIEKANKFIKVENLRIKKNPSTLLVHDVEMTVYVFSLQPEKSE
jgi:Tfp pilus assembly protein PilO